MLKHRFFRTTALIAAILVLLLVGGCENALTEILQAIEDQIFGLAAPTVSPTPGTTITAHETIKFEFSESIDPSTLVFGGSMGPYAVVDRWEDFPFTNGTVYVKPASDNFWDDSPNQTLTVSCISVPELNEKPKALVDYSIPWGVFRGVCVDPDTTSVQNGTAGSPWKSLQDAITDTDSIYSVGGLSSTVRIRGSSTPIGVNYQLNPVTLQAGISLSGSYDSTWSKADRAVHPTILEADHDTAGTITSTNPNRVINCPTADIGPDSVIENLVIWCGTLGYERWDAGIFCDEGSPIIRGVKILGKIGGAGDHAYGIYLSSSAAQILNCEVFNEWLDSNVCATSQGIHITSSAISNISITGSTISGGRGYVSTGIMFDSGVDTDVVSGSIIDGGIGTTAANAIRCEYSSPTIDSNTIYAASSVAAGQATCISIYSNNPLYPASPEITSNSLRNTPRTDNATAIYEEHDYSDPTNISGNIFSYLGFDFNQSSNRYYFDDDGKSEVLIFSDFDGDVTITTTTETADLSSLGNSYQTF